MWMKFGEYVFEMGTHSVNICITSQNKASKYLCDFDHANISRSIYRCMHGTTNATIVEKWISIDQNVQKKRMLDE